MSTTQQPDLPSLSASSSSKISSSTSSSASSSSSSSSSSSLSSATRQQLPRREAKKAAEEEEWIRGSAPRTEGVDAEVRGIVKFLEEVDEYKPTVPEAVVRQYLQLGGTATDDPRTLKLVALATDNFLANIVKEARDIGKLRVGNKRPNPNGSGGGGEDPDADVPLTMEDIAESLRSKGIKITKPSSAVHSE